MKERVTHTGKAQLKSDCEGLVDWQGRYEQLRQAAQEVVDADLQEVWGQASEASRQVAIEKLAAVLEEFPTSRLTRSTVSNHKWQCTLFQQDEFYNRTDSSSEADAAPAAITLACVAAAMEVE